MVVISLEEIFVQREVWMMKHIMIYKSIIPGKKTHLFYHPRSLRILQVSHLKTPVAWQIHDIEFKKKVVLFGFIWYKRGYSINKLNRLFEYHFCVRLKRHWPGLMPCSAQSCFQNSEPIWFPHWPSCKVMISRGIMDLLLVETRQFFSNAMWFSRSEFWILKYGTHKWIQKVEFFLASCKDLFSHHFRLFF